MVSIFALTLLACCAHSGNLSAGFAHVEPASLNKINYNTVAWIEGTAIFIAVFLVATIGSFVDYRKEVQFVKSRAKSEEKNVVSNNF
jgi:hypothetical protein